MGVEGSAGADAGLEGVAVVDLAGLALVALAPLLEGVEEVAFEVALAGDAVGLAGLEEDASGFDAAVCFAGVVCLAPVAGFVGVCDEAADVVVSGLVGVVPVAGAEGDALANLTAGAFFVSAGFVPAGLASTGLLELAAAGTGGALGFAGEAVDFAVLGFVVPLDEASAGFLGMDALALAGPALGVAVGGRLAGACAGAAEEAGFVGFSLLVPFLESSSMVVFCVAINSSFSVKCTCFSCSSCWRRTASALDCSSSFFNRSISSLPTA